MLLLVALGCGFTRPCRAQDRCLDMAVPKQILRDFGHYATAIVKSPAKLPHLNGRDALYLLGFSGATAALIATDTRVSNSITGESGDQRASRYASNILVGTALGTSTIKYLVGCRERNRQRRDDAVREWEAMGFGLGSVTVLKYAFRRQRPGPGSNGDFFDSSTSFPSGHSAIATAWAAVLGDEYPGHLWRYLALGGAGVTSFLRITAREHYPSDVFVGGMIGHLTGEYICRHGKCQETPPKAGIGHGDTGNLEIMAATSDHVKLDPSVYAAHHQFCNSISATREEAERCGQLTPDMPSAVRFGHNLPQAPTSGKLTN